MNSEKIVERLLARCEQLGISSFDVSETIGRNRNYINDLIKGRKKGFSTSELVALSRTLMCDPEYLLGLQDEAVRHGKSGVRVMGTVEPGAWRRASVLSDSKALPLQPDPQFSAENQGAWYVLGDAFKGSGVPGGSVLLAVQLDDPAAIFYALSDGDLVLVEERRDDLEMRTLLSVSRAGSQIVLTSADPKEQRAIILTSPASVTKQPFKIIGLVLQVIRFRG